MALRVVDEVRDDTLQQAAVSDDQRQRVRDVELEPARPASYHPAQDLEQHGRLRMYGEGARLDPAHVEQVRDEVVETRGVLDDRLEQLLTALPP